MDCDFVCIRVQGSYGDDTASELTVVGVHSIFGSSNTVTLAKDSTKGISYIIPAPSDSDKSNHIVGLSGRLTFAAGNGILKVYDGVTTTTKINDEIFPISNRDAKSDIDEKGYLYGTANTATRVDMTTSIGYATAGQLNIRAYQE